jgi:exo-beta-1,3-glucanase (GH17 family)
MKHFPLVHSLIINASSFGTQQLIDYVTQMRASVKEADFMKSRDVFVGDKAII